MNNKTIKIIIIKKEIPPALEVLVLFKYLLPRFSFMDLDYALLFRSFLAQSWL
jgi:hypothetical protein